MSATKKEVAAILERVEGFETAFEQIKEANKEEVKKMMEGMFNDFRKEMDTALMQIKGYLKLITDANRASTELIKEFQQQA